MTQDLRKCPDEMMLYKYLFQELTMEEAQQMEEHFFSCKHCTDKIRAYWMSHQQLQALKAHSGFGGMYKESCLDIAEFPAAASTVSCGVSEVQSIFGKYCIRIIPFLKRDKSILEIELKDKNIDGTLIVENDDGIIFKSEIVNGFAREEVANPVDLRSIIITIKPM